MERATSILKQRLHAELLELIQLRERLQVRRGYLEREEASVDAETERLLGPYAEYWEELRVSCSRFASEASSYVKAVSELELSTRTYLKQFERDDFEDLSEASLSSVIKILHNTRNDQPDMLTIVDNHIEMIRRFRQKILEVEQMDSE